ncbi:hypothetical protein B0I24_104204 [Aliidiomarina maris]|uniref:Uncharacterized protein n=3 Tax=Aliidiomarina maris TaxID=531312 RepID=A0A327WZ25_9GAMM|nr:hypothetical protein B0I24_104204 [Aliidiomarina maris]
MMKTWIVGCITLLGLMGCATTAQQPAEEIYQHREILRTMWPGYDPVARGVGFYNSSDGYVTIALEADTPPSHFSPLSPGVWRSHDVFPQLRQSFYINTFIQDTRATLVAYPLSDPDPFTLLFHEDFHGYQLDSFATREGNTLARFEAGEMPINTLVAAVRMERSLLIAALEAETQQSREQALRNYAGLRVWREAQLPASTVMIERNNETHEGTASWIGHRAAKLLLGRTEDAFLEQRKSVLEFDYEAMEASTSIRLMTARVYSTGAALTELLPQVTNLEWHTLIEDRSTTLFEMLILAFDWSSDFLEGVGQEISNSQEFARAINTASTLSWPESDEAVLARVESEHRWKLSIDMPAGSEGGFSAVGGTITQLTDHALLLHPVQQYDVETDNLSVALRNRYIVLKNSAHLRTSDNEENGEASGRVLTLYLNEMNDSLRCADGETVCEGSLTELTQRGVDIQSETQLPYRLERINQ